MRMTMLTVLVVAGLAPTLLAGPVLAAAVNGTGPTNGATPASDRSTSGLSLDGVILPATR